ncbi:AAA-ATPase At2g46620-like [Typha angustifolia]|uniref:AAA-ATPase At2g46620-like n=1 Tax=Typha angustifolia TaxID=59011 RepID=UPI003C2E8AF1
MLLSLSSSGDPFSLVLTFLCGLVILRIVLSVKSLVYLVGRWWRWLDEKAQVYQNFSIPRCTEGNQENPLYRKANAYVASLPSLEDSAAASLVSSSRKPNDFSLFLGPAHSAHDSFLGARLTWTNEPDRLVIRVRRQDRTRVLRPYLQHLESVADEIELRRRDLRLFTNSGVGGARWSSVAFTHPATLDTVAMDPDLKVRIRSDLESFLKGRTYYQRLGRVWRRSYLLYGPPGTGKSSFAAAMARFLGFDVYDVDLSRGGSVDLRSLLLHTTPRSLILVEDLDRYLSDFSLDSSTTTARLTSILNFMDGICSCCGEERVMVFTMSGGGGKEAIDPAVLRPGRLDVHIHFPMCDFAAFKTLACSYLGLKDHKLYPQVEEGFQSGVKISPAEVGEIMIANRGSPSRAIKTVISALQTKGVERSTIGGARRLRESWSGTRLEEMVNGLGSGGENGGLGNGGGGQAIGFGKESTLREFKKLYGFIKIRNGSRKEGTMAAAAAAASPSAAEGATPLPANGNVEKEW